MLAAREGTVAIYATAALDQFDRIDIKLLEALLQNLFEASKELPSLGFIHHVHKDADQLILVLLA
jgi:hypothetical protein